VEEFVQLEQIPDLLCFFILIIYFLYIIRMPVSNNGSTRNGSRTSTQKSSKPRSSVVSSRSSNGSRRSSSRPKSGSLRRIAVPDSYCFDVKKILSDKPDGLNHFITLKLMDYGNLNQKHSKVTDHKFTLETTTADGAVVFKLNKNTGAITYELDPDAESGEKNDWAEKDIKKLVNVLTEKFVMKY